MTLEQSATSQPPHAPRPEARETAIRAARVCDQYRGQQTIILDLSGITPLFDYFIISTATNRRQMHAMADEVSKMMKASGSTRLGIEGYDTSSWIVADFGDVVLHVFTPETRARYELEHLWADAPRIDWQNGQADGQQGTRTDERTDSAEAVEQDGTDRTPADSTPAD